MTACAPTCDQSADENPSPSDWSCAGNDVGIEQLEEAGDVHVLGHRLAGDRIPFGAWERQLQHLDAGAGELHGRKIFVAAGRLGARRVR